jgi:hypothetical protein
MKKKKLHKKKEKKKKKKKTKKKIKKNNLKNKIDLVLVQEIVIKNLIHDQDRDHNKIYQLWKKIKFTKAE